VPQPFGLLAVGASAGGPEAIEALLTRLPADVPPIVIVQHMPQTFIPLLVRRLDDVCPMRVRIAVGGEAPARGTAYIAPGKHHLIVEQHDQVLGLRLTRGPQVHFQRPSVDVLFQSLAKLTGVRVVAALLTGMGHDGAAGMIALRAAGHLTIAEDESSCAVFGMPREAIARGGASQVLPIAMMAPAIVSAFQRQLRPSAPQSIR
jgi:two-component system chemotaxis response regulator CheB